MQRRGLGKLSIAFVLCAKIFLYSFAATMRDRCVRTASAAIESALMLKGKRSNGAFELYNTVVRKDVH